MVVTSFRADTPLAGVVLFLTYAGAMGVMVGTAAIAVALARTSLIGRARAAGGWLPLLGGALLLVAGLYVAWYGFWELRVLHAGAGADPVVSAAENIQQFLADAAPWIVGIGLSLLAALLVIVLLHLLWGRREERKAERNADRDPAEGKP